MSRNRPPQDSPFQKIWSIVAALLTAASVILASVNTVMSRDRDVTTQLVTMATKIEFISHQIDVMREISSSLEKRVDTLQERSKEVLVSPALANEKPPKAR